MVLREKKEDINGLAVHDIAEVIRYVIILSI